MTTASSRGENWIPPAPQPRFHDWVGSCGLQEDIACGTRLEDLANLDRGRWMIVGLTVYPRCGAQQDGDQVHLYVVDKSSLGATDDASATSLLLAHAEKRGAIAAQRVSVPGLTAAVLLAQMKHVQLQLHSVRLRDYPIHVLDSGTDGID